MHQYTYYAIYAAIALDCSTRSLLVAAVHQDTVAYGYENSEMRSLNHESWKEVNRIRPQNNTPLIKFTPGGCFCTYLIY